MEELDGWLGLDNAEVFFHEMFVLCAISFGYFILCLFAVVALWKQKQIGKRESHEKIEDLENGLPLPHSVPRNVPTSTQGQIHFSISRYFTAQITFRDAPNKIQCPIHFAA